MAQGNDHTAAAIEDLIDRIVAAALERPAAERADYIRQAVEAIRIAYRQHYAGDSQGLADAMAMATKIAEWAEQRLEQAERPD